VSRRGGTAACLVRNPTPPRVSRAASAPWLWLAARSARAEQGRWRVLPCAAPPRTSLRCISSVAGGALYYMRRAREREVACLLRSRALRLALPVSCVCTLNSERYAMCALGLTLPRVSSPCECEPKVPTL